MRGRLFKTIYAVSMLVFFISIGVAAIGLYDEVPEVGAVQLFWPLLAASAVATVLSVLLAWAGADQAAKRLSRIDIAQPDERDVEEELKPLVRRLNDQNRQIRSQMEELAREHDRQDRIRREFTANVSHELKTPLTSISGIAELMRDGLVKPEDVPGFAGRIYEEAQRLVVLVGDIIRLSRLEDPAVALRLERLSVYALAEQVLRQQEPAAKKRNVKLILQGDPGMIVASPRITEEILFNLCDNAVKYNRPQGSVTVRIRDEADHVAVSVEDTGIGIPKEELPRIFERFYRVDKSHSRDMGGTGLGLSIVKHGAANLGAEVQVESTLEKGTVITVLFRRSQEDFH